MSSTLKYLVTVEAGGGGILGVQRLGDAGELVDVDSSVLGLAPAGAATVVTRGGSEAPDTPVEIQHPEVPHPEVPHPEVPHPEVPHPEVPHPEVPHPEVPHPDPGSSSDI